MPQNVTNKQWLLSALDRDARILADRDYIISPALLDDEDVIMAAIKSNAVGTRSKVSVLPIASDRLRDKPEIVAAAVASDGMELSNASDRLRDDKEYVLSLVSKYPFSMRGASNRLQEDLDVGLAMARAPRPGRAVYSLMDNPSLLDNEEFVLAWLNGEGSASAVFEFMDDNSPIRSNKKVALTAVSKDAELIRDFSKELQQDLEVIAAGKSWAARTADRKPPQIGG